MPGNHIWLRWLVIAGVICCLDYTTTRYARCAQLLPSHVRLLVPVVTGLGRRYGYTVTFAVWVDFTSLVTHILLRLHALRCLPYVYVDVYRLFP